MPGEDDGAAPLLYYSRLFATSVLLPCLLCPRHVPAGPGLGQSALTGFGSSATVARSSTYLENSTTLKKIIDLLLADLNLEVADLNLEVANLNLEVAN